MGQGKTIIEEEPTYSLAGTACFILSSTVLLRLHSVVGFYVLFSFNNINDNLVLAEYNNYER